MVRAIRVRNVDPDNAACTKLVRCWVNRYEAISVTKRPIHYRSLRTDQQSHHMMSCAGNTHLQTPAMDRLAERGTRFTRAYASNPVCSYGPAIAFVYRTSSGFGGTKASSSTRTGLSLSS